MQENHRNGQDDNDIVETAAYLGYGRHGSCHGSHFNRGAKFLGKIKICDLQFFESLFFAPYNHLLQSCINAAPLSNALKSGVLRQHHQALWQNWGIVTQHEGQIL